jgi:serine/threonine protein kinase
MKAQLLTEIKIQSFMRHSNLIQLYTCFHDEARIYLFMELGTEGHLYELLSVKGKF